MNNKKIVGKLVILFFTLLIAGGLFAKDQTVLEEYLYNLQKYMNLEKYYGITDIYGNIADGSLLFYVSESGQEELLKDFFKIDETLNALSEKIDNMDLDYERKNKTYEANIDFLMEKLQKKKIPKSQLMKIKDFKEYKEAIYKNIFYDMMIAKLYLFLGGKNFVVLKQLQETDAPSDETIKLENKITHIIGKYRGYEKLALSRVLTEKNLIKNKSAFMRRELFAQQRGGFKRSSTIYGDDVALVNLLSGSYGNEDGFIIKYGTGLASSSKEVSRSGNSNKTKDYVTLLRVQPISGKVIYEGEKKDITVADVNGKNPVDMFCNLLSMVAQLDKTKVKTMTERNLQKIEYNQFKEDIVKKMREKSTVVSNSVIFKVKLTGKVREANINDGIEKYKGVKGDFIITIAPVKKIITDKGNEEEIGSKEITENTKQAEEYLTIQDEETEEIIEP